MFFKAHLAIARGIFHARFYRISLGLFHSIRIDVHSSIFIKSDTSLLSWAPIRARRCQDACHSMHRSLKFLGPGAIGTSIVMAAEVKITKPC